MTNAENFKIKQTKINNISFKELSIIKDFIFWVDILPDAQTYKNAIFVIANRIFIFLFSFS